MDTSESMFASYDEVSRNRSKNIDFEFNSPVFYLPPVMPLQSDTVYAPFEMDENGTIQYPVREQAADYSYDNDNWQSQVGGYAYQQQFSSVPLNDELPMSPTDSLTTSSSSEEDQDMMPVDGQKDSAVSSASLSLRPPSCFSSIAGFALQGYF